MKIYNPVKPFKVIQGFGANPAYYARFKDSLGNPEKGHRGLDIEAPHGTPLYAPCDGTARYVSDSHGGDGIYLRVNSDQGSFDIIMWHLCSKDDFLYKPKIKCDGLSYPVKLGDLIGYADNTGAPFESSGDHLHLGLLPVDPSKGIALYPGNGYGGCIDPTPYLNGLFAQDIPVIQSSVDTSKLIVNEIETASLSSQDKVSLLESLKKVGALLMYYITHGF